MNNIVQHITNRPMYLYILLLSMCATGGLQAARILFDNFAVHVVHLNGNHIGMIQSIREIPGFLSLFVIYILFIIKEHRLASVSVLILGAGIALTGFFPTYYGLIFTTLIMSFGFHYFETTNQSLTLQYFDKDEAPLVFGRLRSLSSACNISISIFFLVIGPFFSFNSLYLFFGLTIMILALSTWRLHPEKKNIVPQQRKMIFKKKYWLFYLLTFLAGARRQIFTAFAVFLLVKKFDFSIQEIAILFLINNLVNYFLSPLIGRSIVRYGEQKILSVEYFALLFVFCGYALVSDKYLAGLLYILDHVFFNFSIAIRTFFQKIANPEDIAPSMAVGFTINHIAAVVLPAIGGLLWLIDYRIPFLAGALLSFVSLLSVQSIPAQLKQTT
ncbi:MFS transporter [Desulfomarina profundi]|uniref:MFS transporter n=1 Tax=Desulfomarina profundi TaxID=2772557 RepID=A0A8D5FMF1_9BACT|nr:MFS transporter [Desulfomarina profundi]BCL60914.1 MFS transporter [Desulfomarina profundi]